MTHIVGKCVGALAAGTLVLAAIPAEARPHGYRGGGHHGGYRGVGPAYHGGYVARGYVGHYGYRTAYAYPRYGYYPGYYRPYPVYGYGYGYGGYYGAYHHYHNGAALAIGAGLLGVLVGTAIAPRREYHYYREAPPTYAPPSYTPPPAPPRYQEDYPPDAPMPERG